MKLTVVGGQCDGEEYEVENGRKYIKLITPTIAGPFSDKECERILDVGLYLVEEISVKDRTFYFLRHEGLSIEDAIARLLCFYRPNVGD